MQIRDCEKHSDFRLEYKAGVHCTNPFFFNFWHAFVGSYEGQAKRAHAAKRLGF